VNNNYGLGGIFKPKNSSRFSIRYSVNGKQFRESARTTSEAKAKSLLKKRLGEIEAGRHAPRQEKISLSEVLDGLVVHYELNNRKSLRTLRGSLKHLREAFDDMPAIAVTTHRVREYILARIEEGAAPASINLELAHLRKAFNLMVQDGRLNTKPHISSLRVDNARRGFVEPGDFERLRAALPSDIRDLVSFLYLSGWRTNEALTLRWPQVDLNAREVRLDPRNSKNKKARTLPLFGELLAIFQRAHVARRLDTPHVFVRDGGPIVTFRTAWIRATEAAGLSGLHVHDLRRRCVRNLIRSGIPERVAMDWTGHLTRSVFDRYNVVSDGDLRQAAVKLASYVDAQQNSAKVAVLKSSAELAQNAG
jgi:integrase